MGWKRRLLRGSCLSGRGVVTVVVGLIWGLDKCSRLLLLSF
jgi:hypothetical protein